MFHVVMAPFTRVQANPPRDEEAIYIYPPVDMYHALHFRLPQVYTSLHIGPHFLDSNGVGLFSGDSGDLDPTV